MFVIQTAISLGLVYALISMSLYISFRILKIADLTTDGSFVFGMAVSVALTRIGYPVLGVILGGLAGGLAGFVTAKLFTKYEIPAILAGIITATGLYTINLFTLGLKPNLSILKQETIFTQVVKMVPNNGNLAKIVLLAIIVLLVMILINWFFQTRLGLSIRATGDNLEMVKSSSINPSKTFTIGLVLANILTGLSGALVGQLQRTADVNAGIGIVVVALASLVIGETVVRSEKISYQLVACVIGNILYRFLYALILKSSYVPIEALKLVTSLIVAIAIGYPAAQKEKQTKKKMKLEEFHA